ncbi:MAG: hypothetical protein COW71_07875 [Ignavibacteriales bacterium CG18_big_fil_WC_8_21_14_2_50_31_20]|nr:MAG: hypothetical protein COW71_07875 [Ignavibacteriales bacterium CG18_big_fil_WC_8_21_14_2_50_31_20]
MSKLRLPKGLFEKNNHIWYSVYNSKIGKTEKKTTKLAAIRANLNEAKLIRTNYLESLKENKVVIRPIKSNIILLRDAKLAYKTARGITGEQNHIDYAVKIAVSLFGNMDVSNITIEHGDLYNIHLRDYLSYSKNTIANYSKAMTSLFTFLLKRGKVSLLPFESTPGVKITPKAINSEDLTKIFNHLSTERKIKNRTIPPNLEAVKLLKLLLYTGLRIGEAVKAKWRDVDFELGTMTVGSIEEGFAKQRTQPDIMPLTFQAIEFLKSIYQGQSKTEKIVTYINRSPKFLERALFDIFGNSRYYTLHQFRKTFITNLVESGMRPERTMMFARHKKYQTTLDHYNERKLQEAITNANEVVKLFDV